MPHVRRARAGGDLDRTIRVHGDRRGWRDVYGNIRFTEPAFVDAVDVGWTSAYGGVDEVALAKNGDPIAPYFTGQGIAYPPRFGTYAYPRNRAGKGYLVDASPEALERCQLPNLEDPAHPLTPERLAVGRPEWWPAAALPASFGWLPYNYFPRMAMLALVPRFDAARFTPDDFAEVRAGVLKPASVAPGAEAAERLDVAAAQQSAVGMRATHVPPGSQVELTALHPAQAVWRFAMPLEVPRMVVEIPSKGPIDLAPSIRTVLLEPDRERLVLTWVGEHVEEVPVGPDKAEKFRFFARWTN